MAYQPSAPDIPLQISVPSTSKEDKKPQISAERRINPSWTISQLKAKLEPITGIPPACQHLRIRGVDGDWVVIGAGEEEEEGRRIGEWAGCRRGGSLEIHDTRPQPPFTTASLSSVEKYTMPAAQYASLPSTVLAYKRSHQLGRFDPHAKPASELAQERTARDEAAIRTRQIAVGTRCRVNGADERRGVVAFVGAVDGLGGERERGARWVGVRLDEPVGRNDGCVSVLVQSEDGERGRKREGQGEEDEEGKGKEEMKRLFDCQPGFGVVVRPEKVEVGDEWTPLDDLGAEMDDDGEEEEL